MKAEKQIWSVDRMVLYLTYGLFLMPILPKLLGNILVGLFVLTSIISYLKTKVKRFNWKFFMATTLIYFCYFTSLLYSDNFEYALKKLGTAIPLLLFPLALSFHNLELIESIKSNLKNLIKVYVGTIIIISCVTIFKNLELLLNFEELHSSILKKGTVVGMDALYLSLHLALALIFSVYLYFLSKKVWKTIVSILLIIFLFSFLLILSFKSAIISFAIAFGLYSLMVNKTKLWVLFMSSTILVVGLLSFSVYFNQQFNKLLIVKGATDIEYAEIKKAIQSCSIKLIPEAGLFGFGLGDGKEELINCYDGKNSDLKQVSYNSHNQYLSLSLNVGLIGLILFSVTLFILLFTGLNRKNYLGIAVLVLFGVFMLAENVLERQQGVIYFALFLYFLFVGDFKRVKTGPLVLSHERVIDSFD